MNIGDILKKKEEILQQRPRAAPKVEYEFQDIGLDLESMFGSSKAMKSKIWPLFSNPRYNRDFIKEAIRRYQNRKDKSIASFQYFMAILNNVAGIKKK